MKEALKNQQEMDTHSLHTCTVHHLRSTINKTHIFFHFIAILALLYYRISHLFSDDNVPVFTWGLMTTAELTFTFVWVLMQAFRWRPVTRTVSLENFPANVELPGVDVFVCTADPKKEPVVEVMNTVLSAMALDYPPEKLAVYLSDDGGAALTLYATKEACSFARSWLPFCRKYRIKTRCPRAFFSSFGDDDRVLRSDEFKIEEENMKVSFVKIYMYIHTHGSNNSFAGYLFLVFNFFLVAGDLPLPTQPAAISAGILLLAIEGYFGLSQMFKLY